MGSIKDELEEELWTYRDRIKYGLRVNEDLQDVTQLRKLGTVLKAELRNQANEHKEEIDSFIGPSHGHQSLPTKAQHNKGMRLNKQEISDNIRAQLQLEIEIRHNTQDHKWVTTTNNWMENGLASRWK